MKKPPEPELKKFKITAYGESTYQWAPSKSDILQMLQQAGALDKDTIVEEVDPNAPEQRATPAAPGVSTQAHAVSRQSEAARYFTLPGGQKVKEVGDVMYSLEWVDFTRRQVIERMNCEDIKFPDGHDSMQVLDWVELQPEGEEDASKTDSDV